MNVLLVNGSPHEKGATYTALCEVENALNNNGIETKIFWIGNSPIAGCIGCNACLKTGRCFRNDVVNEFLDMASEYDGYIFGSAVHFAASTGALSSFMDRVFYGRSSLFSLKPAAAVVSCRRGGASSAFDEINKYFSISNMPIISSQYWNQVHGTNEIEVKEDKEGMQTMRTLGKNMAYFLKCIEMGRKNGVEIPQKEDVIRTNFIKKR